MAALDRLEWFLKNVEDESDPEIREWLWRQAQEIKTMKTENERQRAVRRLMLEYKEMHFVD
jgi:hypothetical protein